MLAGPTFHKSQEGWNGRTYTQTNIERVDNSNG